MTSAAVRGIALEISKSPQLRPFSEPQDIPWVRARSAGIVVTGRGSGKTHRLLIACRLLKDYVLKQDQQTRLSMPVLTDPVDYDSTLRKMLQVKKSVLSNVPDVAFYCSTSPDRWSASEKWELNDELDSAIAFLSELAPPSTTTQDPPGEGDADQGLQLARERRSQLLAQEKWIDAPAVHLQQGGRPDSQGVNNTASRLRRGGELLGAWNGREYLHPTFQFRRDSGLLMPEMKVLLGLLPADRSGWRQAFWLFQPHAQLGGSRPADVFPKDPKAVIEAARSDFEISDERW
ncbi:MAG: hypothetical protein QOI59_4464 [Gammaproteobacteria bacterium]|jgi:hypothetical protein|nr:hypothetical protein [Gammaproteobacteria bacterium]